MEKDVIEEIAGLVDVSIDRENGIIRNVALLGPVSKNNREYEVEALKSGVDLFDGVKAYFNHPTDTELKERGGQRDIRECFGYYFDPHYDEPSVKIRADLQVLENFVEEIFPKVEQMSDKIGLSPHMKIEVVPNTKPEKVVKLIKVHSTDLVPEPATNKNLFEAYYKEVKNEMTQEELQKKETELKDLEKILKTKESELQKLEKSLKDKSEGDFSEEVSAFIKGLQDLQKKMFDKSISLEDASSQLAKLLKGTGYGYPAPAKGSEEAIKVLEEKIQNIEKEKKDLKEKVDKYELKEKVEAKKAKVQKMIEESELKKDHVSEVFLTTLEALEDEKEIKTQIEDRVKLVKDSAGKVTDLGKGDLGDKKDKKDDKSLTDEEAAAKFE